MTSDLPPSTLKEFQAILYAYNAQSPRTVQKDVGPSEIGTPCLRQLAYRVAGAPQQPEPDVPWAPMQGTAVHAFMEKVARWQNKREGWDRFLVEERLMIRDPYPYGTGDLYDQLHCVSTDWKHVGVTTLRKARAGHINPSYVTQGHLYCLGHENAGRSPKFVRIVFLARSHDYNDGFEFTEPYDRQKALDALEWLDYATYEADRVRVSHAWDEVATAEDDSACGWCRYRNNSLKEPGWLGCPGVDPEKKLADAKKSFGKGLTN